MFGKKAHTSGISTLLFATSLPLAIIFVIIIFRSKGHNNSTSTVRATGELQMSSELGFVGLDGAEEQKQVRYSQPCSLQENR